MVILILQVKLLHAALEQEKSKVKGLQTDQPKHQVGTPDVCILVHYKYNLNRVQDNGLCLRCSTVSRKVLGSILRPHL